MAISGLVTGILGLVLGIAFIFIYIVAFRNVFGTDYSDCLDRAGTNNSRISDCVDFWDPNTRSSR
jgi:hypothetical protein